MAAAKKSATKAAAKKSEKRSAKSIGERLLLKTGQAALIVGTPTSFTGALESIPRAAKAKDSAIALLFAQDKKQLEKALPKLIKDAAGLRIWIAYPKAGQLETDLNRNVLHKHVEALGLRAFRQVALDETWSALGFAPT